MLLHRGLSFGTGISPHYHGYIERGLIGYWDGIDNVGLGDDAHSEESTEWVDLVAGNNITPSVTGGLVFGDDCAKFGAVQNVAGFSGYGRDQIRTLEIVIKPYGKWQVFFTFSTGAPSSPMTASRWFALRDREDVEFNFGNNGTHSVVATPFSIHHYAGSTSMNGTSGLTWDLYLDGDKITNPTAGGMYWKDKCQTGTVNSMATTYYQSDVYSIRLYDRILSASEVNKNYTVDINRFKFG